LSNGLWSRLLRTAGSTKKPMPHSEQIGCLYHGLVRARRT
jgi:hypothetical protein